MFRVCSTEMDAVGCCTHWRPLYAAAAAVVAAYSHGVVDQKIEVAFVASGSVRRTYTVHPCWTVPMTIHDRSSRH